MDTLMYHCVTNEFSLRKEGLPLLLYSSPYLVVLVAVVAVVAIHPEKMICKVGATQVEEDILKYAEKIADSIMTVKSDETVMRDKEKEADSIMTVKSEETVMADKEKEADSIMTVKSDETVMEDKEKEGYQKIKKRRYTSYGLEVYPAHPQLMISAPEKSTNTGRKLLEPEQKKDEEGRMMSHKVGATQVVEDIVRYAEKIVDSYRTMKSEETVMEDKENEGYQKIKKRPYTYDGLDVYPVHPHQWVSSPEKSTNMGCKLLELEQRKYEEMSHIVGATQVEEDIVRYAEKIVDSFPNMKSEETVMEDKEKKGYQKIKKRPYTDDGLDVYPAHPHQWVSSPEKSTNTGCKLLEPEQRKEEEMSYKVGATQAEEDISKNAEKIVDSYQNMKSEETVTEDKEKKVDPFLTMNFDEKVYSPHLEVVFCPPEESTDSDGELLEPEPRKDEEGKMWYNVIFCPGIRIPEQMLLLKDNLTGDIYNFLPNIEDESIMEVFMTKEDAATFAGLEEVLSVEPFLGVHKYHLLKPPGPEVGYCTGMSRKVEEDILKYAEKIADSIMTMKSDETVMRNKEKEGYQKIKKLRYTSYGLEVYPAHPQLMIPAPEKSTNMGRKLLEPEHKKDEEGRMMSHKVGATQVLEDIVRYAKKIVDSYQTMKSEETVMEDKEKEGRKLREPEQRKDEEGRMMSYKVGATQAEVDISKNAEKIVDTYQNMKSEETVTEDKEKKVDRFLTMTFDEKVYSPHLRVMFCPPEESTDSDCELLEPEPRKDEEGRVLQWYNVRFCPGIRIPEQMLLLKDNLTGDRSGFLRNIEDKCIMEVLMTKENAATFAGLEEILSVEPFLGVHKYHRLKPPGPEVGYCTGMIRKVGATQVEEDILKYAEKIADSIMTVKSDETVMRDKEKEADSIMTVKSEETVMADKEKEADPIMTVKSDETVMEDKEKEGYQKIKKRRYTYDGFDVYPAHPQLMISAPEKSTNTGRKLLEPEQKKEEGRMVGFTPLVCCSARRPLMSHKVGTTQVVEDIVRYAEKIVDSFRTMKSEETIMEDKENEGYQKIKKHPNTYDGLDVYPVHPHQWVSSLEKSTHTGCKLLEPEQRKDEEMSHMVGPTQVEEDIVRYAEKIVDSYQNMKSEETVMEDKEKKGYQKFKKCPYTYDGLDVYPVHPHQWVSSPEKSTNTGCKLLEPEQRKDEEMSYKVGATQAEEDISKNAEKIVDSYQNMKSEETVTEDKEKKVDPFLTMNFDEKVYSPHLEVVFCPPEESTDSDGELLEPEPRKDEEGKMWYNVIFCPGIRIPEQMLLLKDNLTGDIYNFLPNIEDESIMEVFMTKEDAATFAGLEEVLSVEPFLGVHKYHLLKPPGPEVGYCTGVLSLDPFVYF
ncbi:hypothetical protein GQ457_07G038030 [Hibiscus cannabinus]